MRIDIPPEGIEYYWKDQIILAIVPHAVEGDRVTVYFGGGDIVGPRNVQLGQIGTTPGGDISAGGDGSPDNPRLPLNFQYDNGGLTTIYDGRKRRIARFAGNHLAEKNLIDFYAPVHLHGPLLVYDATTKKWVRKL